MKILPLIEAVDWTAVVNNELDTIEAPNLVVLLKFIIGEMIALKLCQIFMTPLLRPETKISRSDE